MNIKAQDSKLILELTKKGKVLSEENLTISRNLDTMLIIALDRILSRNRIGRLSLKNVKIGGKIRSGTVSSMIIHSVSKALTL